jgi:GntR family phosphonate transport system transcriptional regulator
MRIWESIAETLRQAIQGGQYAAGSKLPTEAALATRFGVNRHTLRRAIAALREEGLVYSRRGAGVFVQHQPTEYPLGKRVRFNRNLLAAGQTPTRKLLLMETRNADQTERRALHLDSAAPRVHALEGLSLADGEAIALFRSVFPAERFPRLPQHLANHSSISEALSESGLTDYVRHSTRLAATRASPTQAGHLRLESGAPLLRAVSINVDLNGSPVEYGRTWFAGDRVALVVGEEAL